MQDTKHHSTKHENCMNLEDQHILVQTSRKIDSDHIGWFQTEAGNWYNHAYGYGLVGCKSLFSAEDGEYTIFFSCKRVTVMPGTLVTAPSTEIWP